MKNYDFKNKILGVIDYSTAFVNLLWNYIDSINNYNNCNANHNNSNN